jgi:FkbM family methyltransferase
MNYAFKVLLKEPFHLLTSVEGRRFLRLCWSIGGIKRHTAREIRILGQKFRIVDNWSFLWQYYEIFYKQAYAFNTDKQDPIVFDCGSNVGLSVLYFKSQYPDARVICFEPDPDIYQVLLENTKHLELVEVRSEAVWVHNNGIQLTRDHADGAFISDEGDSLKSIRLKDLLSKYQKVDFLKLDIEGAEFSVVDDCKEALGVVDRLFIELHTFAGKPQNVAPMLISLEKLGFRYFLENANTQDQPMKNNWKVSNTGMDMQINLYAIRTDESSFS